MLGDLMLQLAQYRADNEMLLKELEKLQSEEKGKADE